MYALRVFCALSIGESWTCACACACMGDCIGDTPSGECSAAVVAAALCAIEPGEWIKSREKGAKTSKSATTVRILALLFFTIL